jgi:hypothetical protein
MGFSRYSTDKQEKSEDGIPIWGRSTAYQNPPIESIVPHLFARPARSAPTKSREEDEDADSDVEEEDLGVKGGWASDSDKAESSFESIDWDKARKKQRENIKNFMRWTPYLRDDNPDEESADALSEEAFGFLSPPTPVLEMMDLFREAMFNGLYPSNGKMATPPAPPGPASKMGPSTTKPDSTTKSIGKTTKVASPPPPKSNANTATKAKIKVDKQGSSHDRPGLGIDTGAKAGPSKLRA